MNKEQSQFSDNIDVIDADTFSSGKTLGLKEIAMEQYKRCMIEGSKEMHPAGERTILYNGTIHKIMVPNTCESFYNSVELLRILLLPKSKEHEATIKNLLDEYKNLKKEFDIWRQETKNEINNSINIAKMPGLRKLTNETNNLTENRTYEKDIRIVELARKQLEILSTLMSVCNYFDESYGGM